MAAPLDETDRKILRILQANARTSNSEIARQLGMVPSAILERIRKLETRGVILGYEARLDPKAMGRGLVAFISLRASDRAEREELEARLLRVPEIQEIHCVAGEDCYLLKVRVPDVDALRTLLYEKMPTDMIVGTKTTIALSNVEESGRLPVDPAIMVSSSSGTTRP
jgi:Lrp/AsnC family transcriptional regulator, leucine-responsive regulatory protein